MANKITVESTINVPVEKAWEIYTEPEHITKWNQASDDWHTTRAENDLRAGGRFNSRMEAKDGSSGFDFSGVYDEVVLNKKIAYTMDGGRKAEVTFEDLGGEARVAVTFDAEEENSLEVQKTG